MNKILDALSMSAYQIRYFLYGFFGSKILGLFIPSFTLSTLVLVVILPLIFYLDNKYVRGW